MQSGSSEVFLFPYRVVHLVDRGSLPLLSCWQLAVSASAFSHVLQPAPQVESGVNFQKKKKKKERGRSLNQLTSAEVTVMCVSVTSDLCVK